MKKRAKHKLLDKAASFLINAAMGLFALMVASTVFIAFVLAASMLIELITGYRVIDKLHHFFGNA